MSDSDESAFLRAILADPDDDAPRLVFADWLDEHAQSERAEFIRVQCALASLTDGDPAGPALRRRETELREAPVLKPLLPPGVTGTLQRGFLDEVAVDAEVCLRQGPGWLRDWPLRRLGVTRLTPTHFPEAVIRAIVVGKRLRGLSLAGGVSPASLASLLAAPELAGLRSVRLSCPPTLAAGQAEVLASLPRLEELNLEVNRLGAEVVRDLVAWPGWPTLRRLHLSENQLGPDGALLLAAAPPAAALESLSLGRNYLYERGVTALATARLPALRSLDLNGNECGDGGLRALLASPLAGQLTELNLGGNALTASAVAILADWPGLRQLRGLSLHGGSFAPALPTLIRSPHWGRPYRLDLSWTGSDATVLLALAASPMTAELRELSLWGGAYSDVGLRALADSPFLPRELHLQIDMTLEPPNAALGFLRGRFDWVS